MSDVIVYDCPGGCGRSIALVLLATPGTTTRPPCWHCVRAEQATTGRAAQAA